MIEKKVRILINQYNLFEKNDHIVIGLSGGADSVLLFHMFVKLKEEFALTLTVVHVHHGLRKEAADYDCEFVLALCKSFDIECIINYVNVKEEAKKRGMGEEEAGRLLRYMCFSEIAKKNNAKIAVAHHQNDQTETILMHMCRGTGLTGLCGISPVRDDIIRPMLLCSRAEIEDYCKKHNISYCTDSTNYENKYTRNKIRNILVPWLENELNENTVSHISEMAELLREDEEFLFNSATMFLQEVIVKNKKDGIFLSVEKLKNLTLAMKRRVLRQASLLVNKEAMGLTFEHIKSMIDFLDKETGKSLSLPFSLQLEIEYGNMHIFLNKDKKCKKNKEFCYELCVGKAIFIKEVEKYAVLSVNLDEKQDNAINLCTNVFDYDKLKEVLHCRTRKAKDYVSLGRGKSKKLKDFFIDEKIPRQEREDAILIARGSEILWVVGKRRFGDFSVDENTKNTISVQIWEEMQYEGKGGNPDFNIGNQQEN